MKRTSPMTNIARGLRQRQTQSEAILWEVLRDRQILGYKFRRQRPIGRFVVDFFCADAKLVLEIDGLIHNYQQAADIERQQMIEEQGMRFVRVTADQVKHDLLQVLAIIRTALQN
jgi:very-short-patch-repair endonuclease